MLKVKAVKIDVDEIDHDPCMLAQYTCQETSDKIMDNHREDSGAGQTT